MRIWFSLLVILLIPVGERDLHAQPWTTALPSIQGGDYGNGAATSDAVGGVFASGHRASSTPAVAFGIPTGFGADGRDIFGAGGLQRGLRFAPDFTDGAVFGGVGLGDGQRLVGVELTVTVVDLVEETLKDGTLGVKVHRRVGDAWSVAAGVENMVVVGTTDGGTSAYGAVSGAIPLRRATLWFQQLIVTAGVGDGRFNGVKSVRRGENKANVFGSVAVQVHPRISVLATWTGQDLNVGWSVAPFVQLPLVVTPVLLDLSGHAGDQPRFALSTGVGITL